MRLVDLGPGMITSFLRVWLLGSVLFPVQEINHAELMEQEASLSRSAQEEKLSLQQVIKDITQVLVSLLSLVTRLCRTPPGFSVVPRFPLSEVFGLRSCGDAFSEHV